MNYFNNQTSQNSQESYRFNEAEQDRAIKSAETQVKIANGGVKDATMKLTKRVDALETAVSNYYGRLSELGVSMAANSSAGRISSSALNKTSVVTLNQNSLAATNSSEIRSQKSSTASSSTSNASFGKVLVSLKSNVGTIYSLVNKKRSPK